MLLREVDEAGATVWTGKELVGFEQTCDSVHAFFADETEERGAVLVGADGLRSRVRGRLFGDERPRYAGYTSWRGVAPESELVPVGGGFESWGRGRRFGCAHVGGGRVYWFATRNAPEGGDDGPAGSRATLLEAFRGWHEPVEPLIRATEEDAILRTDIYDRDPLGKIWGEGRTTLLGDAAHPMTPNLGQGACQAIEDTVVLARCLRESGESAGALRRYEALRSDRTAAIVRRSRRIGWVGQLENPFLCRLRERALKLIPVEMQLRQIQEVVGYEV
jgi:2-polyprenyl-6-methoxyphenol hydroxylase-like FAD-dependent oxidoreductase